MSQQYMINNVTFQQCAKQPIEFETNKYDLQLIQFLKQKTINHNKTVRINQRYYGTSLQKTKLINIMVKNNYEQMTDLTTTSD